MKITPTYGWVDEMDALSGRISDLQASVAFAVANEERSISGFEKLAVLNLSSTWSTLPPRRQADVLMQAGCYAEAIPLFESLGVWRKVGDARWALGEPDSARTCYERGANDREDAPAFRRGPDYDRLIALAIGSEDWVQVLRLIRQGAPEPFGDNQVVFCGGTRAKSPLLRLTAHAAHLSGDTSIVAELPTLFGITLSDVEPILGRAEMGEFQADVRKFSFPSMLNIKPTTLVDALLAGETDAARRLSTFIENLDPSLRRALANMSDWRETRNPALLDEVVFWLTQTGRYEIFHSCLDTLRGELNAWIEPHPADLEFYVAHPWLTRACMKDLLERLIAVGREPAPSILFVCALQHLTSPLDFSFDDQTRKIKSFDRIRSQPTWAEAILDAWCRDSELSTRWAQIRKEAQPRSDPRRLTGYVSLCDEVVGILEVAWVRDFERVRWKSEEGAYLTLKALLPGTTILRHAMPIWLSPQHLDIFLPELGIAIEYMGEQHYRPIEIFGGEVGFKATTARDEKKRRLCALAGIRLEHVRFDEAVDERIRQIASACELRPV